MTDYSKLKRLADRVIAIEATKDEPIQVAWDEFEAAANPAAVLALIADNEKLAEDYDKAWRHDLNDKSNVEAMVGELAGAQAMLETAYSERDQLKAEVEALHAKIDRLLAHCPEGECATCGEIICPHGGAMHFHHDGCPSCAEHDSAMSQESGHD